MNMGIIIIIAIAGLWALGIFFGAIGGLTKPFSNVPSGVDSSSTKTQEQQTIEDTQERQKAMMEDMKQKMRDAGHNY